MPRIFEFSLGQQLILSTTPGLCRAISHPVAVDGQAGYRARVHVRSSLAATGHAWALVTARDARGAVCMREYLWPDGDSWHRHGPLPSSAASLVLELAAGYGAGEVVFDQPDLHACPPPPPRIVRIGGVALDFPGSHAGNAQAIAQAVGQARQQGVHVLCTTENALQMRVSGTLTERALPPDAPALDTLREAAVKAGLVLCVGCYERAADGIYNSAFLFGPSGDLGVYRKTQLPLEELEAGLLPGNHHAAIDTPFGRIGTMICWEQSFPEVAQRLCRDGAELLLCPTLGYMEVPAAARSADNCLNQVVVCRTHEPLPVRIFDATGALAAHTTTGPGMAFADIDLNDQTRAPWYSVGEFGSWPRATLVAERREGI